MYILLICCRCLKSYSFTELLLNPNIKIGKQIGIEKIGMIFFNIEKIGMKFVEY